MNHIRRLQCELDKARATIGAMEAALRRFQAHLLSPKFQGFGRDGGRTDWIATSDVLSWLRTIETPEPELQPDGCLTAGEPP